MPVKCELRGRSWRIVNAESKQIERTSNDKPVDGGGHKTKEECEKQMRAINSSK